MFRAIGVNSRQGISMPKIVGIDLGTTNSLVAIVEEGAPRIIADLDGSRLVPSVIYFDQAGEVLVGNRAKEKMIDKPENTIFSIKRFMGKGINDVREDLLFLLSTSLRAASTSFGLRTSGAYKHLRNFQTFTLVV